MLNGTLSLHDIRDVEAFTGPLVQRAHVDPADREDLHAWLIEQTWELSLRYERGDLRYPPNFGSWVTPLLKLRIIDWKRQRFGRTTWRFDSHTYERPPRPPHVPLDHVTDAAPADRDPGGDGDARDLVRLLRTRGSDEAWRDGRRRKTMPPRAA